MEKLQKSDQGRVINVSAQTHSTPSIELNDLNREKNFTSREAYAQSKLALILMSRHMSSLLKGIIIIKIEPFFTSSRILINKN